MHQNALHNLFVIEPFKTQQRPVNNRICNLEKSKFYSDKQSNFCCCKSCIPGLPQQLLCTPRQAFLFSKFAIVQSASQKKESRAGTLKKLNGDRSDSEFVPKVTVNRHFRGLKARI